MKRKLAKQIMFMIPVMLCLLMFMTGCKRRAIEDPSPENLELAKNLDITRMYGTVDALSINYYEGDRPETQELKGTPYYSVKISYNGELSGYRRTEIFLGIPVEMYDLLRDVVKLPVPLVMTSDMFATKSGEIIDLSSVPLKGIYTMVLMEGGEVVVYQVPPKLYYTNLRVGMNLPLEIKDSETLVMPIDTQDPGIQ